MLGRVWVNFILRGPGGSTYMAPGVLFWITTLESSDLVMILLNPEKSAKMVSKSGKHYDRVSSESAPFVSSSPQSRIKSLVWMPGSQLYSSLNNIQLKQTISPTLFIYLNNINAQYSLLILSIPMFDPIILFINLTKNYNFRSPTLSNFKDRNNKHE